MTSAIYKIFNNVSEKLYIGSAVDPDKRWREHKYHLNRQTHKNPFLQSAWNLHGENAFEFSIIELVHDAEILLKREQFYLDITQCYNSGIGYNLAKLAGSRAGVPMPQSAKDKIGAASKRSMTGRTMLPQTRAAISKANKGIGRRKGQKQSADEIAKRVAANTGKTRTEETKAKMSEARIGMKFSDAHKANQSLAAKRRWDTYRAAKQ